MAKQSSSVTLVMKVYCGGGKGSTKASQHMMHTQCIMWFKLACSLLARVDVRSTVAWYGPCVACLLPAGSWSVPYSTAPGSVVSHWPYLVGLGDQVVGLHIQQSHQRIDTQLLVQRLAPVQQYRATRDCQEAVVDEVLEGGGVDALLCQQLGLDACRRQRQ